MAENNYVPLEKIHTLFTNSKQEIGSSREMKSLDPIHNFKFKDKYIESGFGIDG